MDQLWPCGMGSVATHSGRDERRLRPEMRRAGRDRPKTNQSRPAAGCAPFYRAQPGASASKRGQMADQSFSCAMPGSTRTRAQGPAARA